MTSKMKERQAMTATLTVPAVISREVWRVRLVDTEKLRSSEEEDQMLSEEAIMASSNGYDRAAMKKQQQQTN